MPNPCMGFRLRLGSAFDIYVQEERYILGFLIRGEGKDLNVCIVYGRLMRNLSTYFENSLREAISYDALKNTVDTDA
eukprot:snap_masked-scaffold_5-processed-gene-8.38-mRNA-1 protein AED:1.00 eAED:1.00 QI:0/0/0/0/1/1/3/0/76